MAVKKTTAVAVEIPQIKIEEATIRIVGTSPLITHKFGDKVKKQLLDKSMQKAKAGREPKNPVAEFIDSLHWITPMPNDHTEAAFAKALKSGARFGFPATGIKQSAVSGAYRAGLTKDKVSVYGAFHINGGELIEIKGTPKMREDYCIVANGAPDLRYRAEFTEWEMKFTIKYNAAVYSLEQIINFLNFGGFSVGIGEWRIEKGGVCGGFKVV